MEEALRFWRAEFAPKMPGDKFDKEHGYMIRHNYGKEGKRTSYTPHSCVKIISATPGQVIQSPVLSQPQSLAQVPSAS